MLVLNVPVNGGRIESALRHAFRGRAPNGFVKEQLRVADATACLRVLLPPVGRQQSVPGHIVAAELEHHRPDEIGHRTFYQPAERGFEREIQKRLDYWNGLRKKKKSP